MNDSGATVESPSPAGEWMTGEQPKRRIRAWQRIVMAAAIIAFVILAVIVGLQADPGAGSGEPVVDPKPGCLCGGGH